MTHHKTRCRTLLLAALLTACGETAPAARPDTANAGTAPGGAPYAYDRIALDTTRPAGTVIDSTFPMPELIRRFRVGLPNPERLVEGARSRQELVSAFVGALAAGDTRALGLLTLSRAEFAYIHYPSSSDAARDNGMPPALRWDLLTLDSEKGVARALDRIGRKPVQLQSMDCPLPPVTRGDVRMHDGCTVRLTLADSSTFAGRLFGSIIEHRGRFKFVGYSNDM